MSRAFAVRESSRYDYVLMEGMVSQTLVPHLEEPGVAEVLEEGLTPLVDPGASRFQVQQFKAHRMSASVWAHEGSVYLYSLGTASSVNTPEGDNAWVRLLCDFIWKFRPQVLCVANFNRLLRSAWFAGELMRAVEGTGTVLDVGSLRIDLATAHGRVLWQTFAMQSDLERDSIVQRLFAGVVNKFRRGEWVLAAEAAPLGYRVEGGRLVLDPEQVEPVRALVHLLADPVRSARDVLDAAGSLGLSTPTLRRLYGDEATVADSKRAESWVRTAMSDVEVWRSGRLVVRHENPFRGASRIGPLDVVDADPPANHGFVVFRYELELPDGGWVSPELLDAASDRWGAGRGQRPTGGAAHRRRRAFAGWVGCVDEEGRRFHLSTTNTHYALWRQDPVGPGGSGVAPSHIGDWGRHDERIASVAPLELHEAIVDAATVALREGAPVELLDGVQQLKGLEGFAIVDTRARQVERFEAELDAARVEYRNARSNANRASNDRLRDDYLVDAERAFGQMERLEREVADLVGAAGALPSLGDSFDSECGFLIDALAPLRSTDDRVSAEVANALSTVIEFVGFRTRHDVEPPVLHVDFNLLLPADGRVARFGPITATVRNRAYRNTLRDDGSAEMARSTLTRVLESNGHCDVDDAPSRAPSELSKLLCREAGWPLHGARTLARSGVVVLLQIAANVLWADPLPDDLDSRYVEHIKAVYSSERFVWVRHAHALDCRSRQLVVDMVVANGGSMVHADLIAALAGTTVDGPSVARFTRTQVVGKAPPWPPCLVRHGDWRQQQPREGRSVSAVACPHCGGWASRVVRTPETPSCLLCPACRRMPVDESPVFPELYLSL